MIKLNEELTRISAAARRAVVAGHWQTVDTCVAEILRRNPNSAEGHYLRGLMHKAQTKPFQAIASLEKSLALDPNRYDAAVELASQYSATFRQGDAVALLADYENRLSNSPFYLNMAGAVYSNMGLARKAWPMYTKATALQPEVDQFQANRATCAMDLGRNREAREIYQSLLRRRPDHPHNHYQLSRLQTAKDDSHIKQMKDLLRRSRRPKEQMIPLFYALGKELEDLEQWEEAFEYYSRGGNAIGRVANCNVNGEIDLIDRIIQVCDPAWLQDRSADTIKDDSGKTPIFVVGLPRSGTTLIERIISSHSQVQSLEETLFLQLALRRESGVPGDTRLDSETILALADKDMSKIATRYMDAVRYRLGNEPMFIEKLPFNYLYLGFIARAWPTGRIVHVVRNPMDACFSLFKQVLDRTFTFTYSLEYIGQYYVAYDRLLTHWRAVLGDRMIEVAYEELVADQEAQTRLLLDRLGLGFEDACLHFDRNASPSTTASSVQVRGKVHNRSVLRWMRFERQLQPLRDHLEAAGIRVE